MARYQYLVDQAERAERLARSAMDSLTVERLTLPHGVNPV